MTTMPIDEARRWEENSLEHFQYKFLSFFCQRFNGNYSSALKRSPTFPFYTTLNSFSRFKTDFLCSAAN